tara:strand:- start:1116 stop:1529 length:414 start_codon:yes stop_codon:yes gene_type:complete
MFKPIKSLITGRTGISASDQHTQLSTLSEVWIADTDGVLKNHIIEDMEAPLLNGQYFITVNNDHFLDENNQLAFHFDERHVSELYSDGISMLDVVCEFETFIAKHNAQHSCGNVIPNLRVVDSLVFKGKQEIQIEFE